MKVGKILGVTVLLASVTACQSTTDSTSASSCSSAPLPKFTISAPDPAASEQAQQFSGLWSGKWGSSLCSRLVILQIDANDVATGYYSWAKGSNFEAGNSEFEAKIIDGHLKFGTRATFDFWFKVGTKTELIGKRNAGGSISRVVMRRTNAPI